MSSRTIPFALAVAAACACDASIGSGPETTPIETAAYARVGLDPEILAALARTRQVTAAFHDIAAAMAAGYTVWSPDPFAPGATCPTSADGAMGYHLVNVNLRGGAANPAAGDAVIDALQPEMLLFEKRADGKLHLVGVEYLVFTAAWEREHGVGAAPPQVFGQPLLASAHTFVPGGPVIAHYELHVWIWKPNPRGMFAPWNPNVSC